jgi:phospholipid/cholesterol/gamma-HCH transport system substrate-binding protein
VKTAIRKHLGDFLAVAALFVLALAIAVFILGQQRLRFPFVQDPPFIVKVELENAQAVQAGQGQTVRMAGVEIGQVGKVQLDEGVAVVDMELEPKYKGLIREDATVLLRTKTGLKDMFMEVDPGEGEPVTNNEKVQVANTLPDIDPDEFLAVLDADTRDYLKLLINGAGKGLDGRGGDLKETFARLGPTHRDLARVTTSIARRRSNLRRLIHNYGLLVRELGGKDQDITRLVQASNATLGAFAEEDVNISRAVAKLPGTLRQTQSTLVKVDRLATDLRPTLQGLRPAVRSLDVANRETLPLLREGTPIIKNQLRPFARSAQPFTQDVGEAAQDLAKAGPDLSGSFLRLNRLFNLGAYNKNGAEGLTGNLTQDRNRQEGYLYYLAWLGQNTVSVFSTSDATGPFRRIFLQGLTCSLIKVQAQQQFAPFPEPLRTLLIDQVNTLADTLTAAGVFSGTCPPS